MARIAGVNLPRKKRMEIALTYIHGIGRSSARKILEKVNIDYSASSDDLTDDQVVAITKALDAYTIEGDLRKDTVMQIKRLMDLGAYRGIRHRKGLPVRGQRTKTNSRTRKGPRRTKVGRK